MRASHARAALQPTRWVCGEALREGHQVGMHVHRQHSEGHAGKEAVVSTVRTMFPRVLAITVLAAVGALTAPAAAQAATPAAGSTLAPRPSGVPAHRAGAPLILGHRGGTERGYQNSMAAFNDAIGLHLDYIETDVRHTADGVAVLIHDPTLPAACTLHPGVAVSALSAAELAKVRCAGQAVPRLTDLVTRLTQPDARHVGAMAEVKDVDPLGIRDALAPL